MKSTSAEAPKQGFVRRELSQWFGNIVGDLWGGAVTTFALLPEVIGFMIVVGVHPYMGLFTCIILTIWLAFTGGRPGMISAGAGSTALVLAGLIAQHGMEHPEYIFACIILAGLIQLVLGLCRIGSLVKFIPTCVMNGFVNGFAIVILVSQLKLCISRPLEMYLLIAAGIGIIIGFPFLKKVVPFLKKVPESFVAIVLVTAYTMIFHSNVPTVGDMGDVTASFQYVGFAFSHIGGIFSGDCIGAIITPAISIAFVGLIESMLTARMVDDETKTESSKNRECVAEGLGNIICGSLGAMPGCGMIAMTVTNLKSGGKGRLSLFVAGTLMAVLLFTLSFLMGAIPLAALCAVMFVVCFHTLNWKSMASIPKTPLKETVVMILTVIVIVGTDNLAYGVGVGIAVFAILYGFSRISSAGAKIGISLAFLAVAAAGGIYGLIGMFTALPFAEWGFVVCMVLGGIGAGVASLAKESKAASTVIAAICVIIGVLGTIGASIAFTMGPWYALMEKAEEISKSTGLSTTLIP